eukprot:3007267-Pleurochrysis_carterae.AAC.1
MHLRARARALARTQQRHSKYLQRRHPASSLASRKCGRHGCCVPSGVAPAPGLPRRASRRARGPPRCPKVLGSR